MTERESALMALLDHMRPHLEHCDALQGYTWRSRVCTCGFEKAKQVYEEAVQSQ